MDRQHIAALVLQGLLINPVISDKGSQLGKRLSESGADETGDCTRMVMCRAALLYADELIKQSTEPPEAPSEKIDIGF